MAKAKSPIPEGIHTVTPQLILDNAAQAIDWYKKALGAEEVSRATGPDGKILHADIKIGDSRIMVNDAMGAAKGRRRSAVHRRRSGSTSRTADALFNRAVGAGAKGRPARWASYAGSVLGRPLRHRSTIRRATAGRSRRARKI